MLNMCMNRLVQVLLAGVFVVCLLVLTRFARSGDESAMGRANPRRAVQTYGQRMRATEKLLRADRLDLSGR